MASPQLESRFLNEPNNVAGLTTLQKAPEWFAPADDAPMGYWRKPDGHIILSQYGENGTEKKLDRGFERLGAKYGSYASSMMGTLKDPLLPLVLAGGLVELPAEQIKLLGWHRAPDRAAKRSHREVDTLVRAAMAQHGVGREEALLLVMPQLRGYDLADYDCAACPGRHFPTEAAKLAHTTVMHKEAIQSESIGKAVAAAQQGNGGGGSGDTAALLQIIAQQGDVIAGMKAQLDALTSDAGAPKAKRGAKTNDATEPAAE